MLPVRREGSRGPLFVMLHWLGGGAQTWTEVSHGLAGRGVRCVAVDLPGFGEAAGTSGFGIEAMTEAVSDTIRSLRAEAPRESAAIPAAWMIAGHSMGGTVAALIARRALDGVPGLEGLRGLVLVSPSPPGPEPMSNGKRAEMLASLGECSGDDGKDRRNAAKFVDENTGRLEIPPGVRERAIEGVLGMNRTAFRQWLERGSKEDWTAAIGELGLPAIVFAGTEDGALGPEAQREHTMPHLPGGELVTLEGAGHLGPLERPGELVERLTQFLAGTGSKLVDSVVQPSAAFQQLLASDRVSPQTRAVMGARLGGSDWNHQPIVFSPAEFRSLRAVAARVVPGAGFDLAARLDRQLAEGKGDGWRFAALPPDIEAWHRGLHSLDLAAQRARGVCFLALFPEQQDELLRGAAAGRLGRGLAGVLHLDAAADAYTGAEMKQWFSDLRAECTRLYVGDPRTMDRIGYTGFADDLGFTKITLGAQGEFER